MRAFRQTTAIALLVASAGSALGQTSWANPAGGVWSLAANWSPMDVPNTSTESAMLGALSGPYTVECDLTATILGVGISSEATLSIGAGRTLMIDSQGILNNGTIVINTVASSSNASLLAASSCSLLGNGMIELNAQGADLNDAKLGGSGPALLTIGAGQTVHGSGALAGPIDLRGVVESDRDGRDLVATGAIDMSGGGTMRGVGGGYIRLQGQVVGGTLDGGVDADAAAATIDGSTSNGSNGVRATATLGIKAGGLTNNGHWLINTVASSSNAMIRADVDATIDGTGVLELNSMGADLNDARLGGQIGATLTLGAGQEVRGSGVVAGPINLSGSIISDRDARDILVSDAVDASAGGVLRGENNGRVALQGQLTGGTIAGGVDASLTLASVNGTVSTGANGVRATSDLLLIGAGLTNNGTITVNTIASSSNARLVAAESTLLDGSGNIDLNAVGFDYGDAQVVTLAGQTLTIGSLQSITGSGRVSGTFVLDGTINADRAGRDVTVQGDLDLTGGGRIKGTNGGLVGMQANLIGGTIEGGVEAEGGIASFNGTTATGANGIRATATASVLAGGLTNNGVLTVNTIASSSNSTLLIAEDATIDGSGSIDLNSISFDLADARLEVVDGVTLTLGADQAVTGSGIQYGTVICFGMFDANRAGRDLSVTGDIDLSGGGVMQGTNGGRVALSGSATGGQWLGGVETYLRNAVVSGVTMSGDNAVRDGSDLNLDAAGITNNGVLLVNTIASSSDARIVTVVDSTIDGSGTVELNAAGFDYGDAQLRAVDVGTLTIGADQTIAGRGLFNGLIRIEGTMSPGDAADATQDFSLIGTTTLAPTAMTKIGIAGPSTSDYDRVSGSATLNLDGTLELTLLDGYTPNFEDRFVIADVGTVTGTFETVITPTIGLGTFRVVIGADTVEAVWTCQADLNGDGITDFFDVLAFLNAFTSEALYGDYNEDGVNDFFDVLAFLNDFALGC